MATLCPNDVDFERLDEEINEKNLYVCHPKWDAGLAEFVLARTKPLAAKLFVEFLTSDIVDPNDHEWDDMDFNVHNTNVIKVQIQRIGNDFVINQPQLPGYANPYDIPVTGDPKFDICMKQIFAYLIEREAKRYIKDVLDHEIKTKQIKLEL